MVLGGLPNRNWQGPVLVMPVRGMHRSEGPTPSKKH